MGSVYLQERLDNLWSFICENGRNQYIGKYAGLQEVAFTKHLAQFEADYKEKFDENHLVQEYEVTTNLDGVLTALSTAENIWYHLSCAANTGWFDDNTVFCIHYQKPNDPKGYSFALPGINYTLSDDFKKKKLEELANPDR
ncbi:MAG: hypothetical protein HGA85_09455 [Nanoarchaeota archaeon]|nr:hypothetical protein [Nanoarchaeota archaeon]